MPTLAHVTDPLEWLYEFISLAEDILAVMYFGKHNSQFMLFLVFMVEPIIENIFKTIAGTTKNKWDDLVFNVLSELVQFYLFWSFSDFDPGALKVFASLCGAQILITIVQTVCKWNEENEPAEAQWMKCISSSVVHISSSIAPLVYLEYMNCSPFQSDEFDYTLTVIYWMNGSTGPWNVLPSHPARLLNRVGA